MNKPPSFRYERAYWQQGIALIAGLDEVGVGALAGPVVAGAVVFAPKARVMGIRDSKQLTAHKRHDLVAHIHRKALAWAIGEASVAEIAEYNIRGAAQLAMRRAVNQLAQVPELLLVDGFSANELHPTIPAEGIIKGDQISFSIAAASILAKEHRDALMVKLNEAFPDFGFADHKGYATAAHKAALERHGITPHHRTTYAPVARLLTKIS